MCRSMVNPTLVYIVGRGHSGSTLLELLLNRSREIAAMGELDLLSLQIYRDERTRWIGRCSCGKRPHECTRWGKILADVDRAYRVDTKLHPFSWKLSDVGLNEELSRPGIIEKLRYGYHRAIRTYFYTKGYKVPFPLNVKYRTWVKHRDFVATRYAEYANVKAVVDASKDQLHLKDIDLYSTLPHKFIYLTRDVRGNVWSAIKRESVTASQEAKDWARLNGKILKILDWVDPKKVLHVNYEELCGNPDEVLAGIFRFIGVSGEVLDAEQEFNMRHTIAGNKIRFKKVDEVRQDLGWVQNLTQKDLEAVVEEAGYVASRLGYDIKVGN